MVGTPIRLPPVLASGQPLRLSPDDLGLAAMVTPLDLILGRALWQRFAPVRWADLLDAMEAA